MSVFKEIKNNNSNVFRRCSIKRRTIPLGTFETSWLDISADVKTWGTITNEVDSARTYKFTFGNVKVLFDNSYGRYNPSTDENSLWYNYVDQQRTLIKIEAGFKEITQRSDGVYLIEELPSEVLWDENSYDVGSSLWDGDDTPTLFTGIISGDIFLSDKNEVSLNAKPLVSVFKEYPAKNLTGWTTTGMTASNFMTLMVRNQQDSGGNYIFRPFFGDTTTNWDISTTTNVYSNLNTSTANGVFDATVWDVIEKLAEAENFVPYVTRDGVFKFVSRTPNTTGVAFEFHGAGSFSSSYGQTIKSISQYGWAQSKYYSRVQLKYVDLDTTTSYSIVESAFTVSSNSTPWVFGHKTLEIENFYIPNSGVADTIAQTIFTEVSSYKRELSFNTTFVPGLELLDRFSVYYDPTEITPNSLWDQYNWEDDSTSTAQGLIWDSSRGDSIKISGQEFKFLSFNINLDTLENSFRAREV